MFARYYGSGANAAPLEMYANLLEMLVAGELLSAEATALLLGHLRARGAGAALRARLHGDTAYAGTSGARLERACQVGIIEPEKGREGATIVVACAEDFGAPEEAARAFRLLGEALAGIGGRPRA